MVRRRKQVHGHIFFFFFFTVFAALVVGFAETPTPGDIFLS